MTARRLALAAILVAAAALRFTALGWGLRHTPHMDERDFVENAWRMVEDRDLDHHFYEYPALFFYLLAPALAIVKTAGPPGPGAYVVARGVVATFGVANVLLLYMWGRRVAGPAAALAAAALLALSPVDVQTSHMVRADVVLETFALLALAALGGVGDDVRRDARAGLALAAATAVKFTGVLLAPSYLLRRALAPGPRIRGLVVAGLVAALASALLTPYALLHARAFVEGAATQVAYHYEERPRAAGPLGMLLSFAAVWPKALGWPAVVFAAAGLALVRREWRTWAPLVALPVVTLLVFASQEVRLDRQMVPTVGVVALLAGVAIASVAARSTLAAVGLCLAVLAVPAAASVAFLRGIARPSTKDLAVDWLDAHVPPGARVVTTIEGLGLDRRRYEVLNLPRLRGRNRLALGVADVVVTSRPGDEALLKGLPTAYVARPASPVSGRPVHVRLVSADDRPRLAPVALDAARLKASQDTASLALVHDGRLDTRWEAAPRRGHEEFVRVDLPDAVRIARIELALGDRPDTAARGLVLAFSEDGVHWRRVRPLPGRPNEDQVGAASQVLLFEPTRARIVRIIATGRGRPWGIAELRIDALSPTPPSPE